MYAQTERGSFSDWADHILIMIYALLGAAYSIYLAGLGVVAVFQNVNVMFTKPTGGALGAILFGLILVVGGLALLNAAFKAFTRMLREGPNPDPKFAPAPKAGFFSDLGDRIFPELGDPSRAAARQDNPTPKQAARRQKDQERMELANQLRDELAKRRSNPKPKK